MYKKNKMKYLLLLCAITIASAEKFKFMKKNSLKLSFLQTGVGSSQRVHKGKGGCKNLGIDRINEKLFKNIKEKKSVCKVATSWASVSFPSSENKPTFDKRPPQHNVLYNCIVPDKLPDKKLMDRCPAKVNLAERNVLSFKFTVEKRSCKIRKHGFLSFLGLHGNDIEIKERRTYNSIGEVFDGAIDGQSGGDALQL